MTSVPDIGVPAAEFLGAELVLVRPDQHIAWLGDRVPVAQAPEILARALKGFA